MRVDVAEGPLGKASLALDGQQPAWVVAPTASPGWSQAGVEIGLIDLGDGPPAATVHYDDVWVDVE